MSTTETTEKDEPPADDIGQDGCCVPESEMLVILDRNFEVPWKGGNKYARVCPECRSRTFCPSSYWESRHDDPSGVAHIVEQGEGGGEGKAVIRPLYKCPYTEAWAEQAEGEPEPCGEEFAGPPYDSDELPTECPHCERALDFED